MSIPAIIRVLEGTPRHESIVEYSIPVQIAYLYFTGSHLGPFWFIPMIFIFYLISPLLLKLCESKYFNLTLAVSFILSIFIYKDFDNVIQCFFHYFFIFCLGIVF